jgi:hypothetical protein
LPDREDAFQQLYVLSKNPFLDTSELKYLIFMTDLFLNIPK